MKKEESQFVVKVLLSTLAIVIAVIGAKCNELESREGGDHRGIQDTPKITIFSPSRIDDSYDHYTIVDTAIVEPTKIFATAALSRKLFLFDMQSNEWRTVSEFPNVDGSLWHLTFVDNSIGFVTGDRGTLLKTTDGGKTWKKVTPFTTYNLYEIVFTDSRTGYLVGDMTLVVEGFGLSYRVAVFKTSDGGERWQQVYSKKNAIGPIFAIAAISSSECIIAVGGRQLLRTKDGGKSWQKVSGVELSENAWITGIDFASNRTGWLIDSKGGLYRSEDGGITWSREELPDESGRCKWQALDINETGQGVAVSEDGCVLFTSDGQRWRRLETAISDQLEFAKVFHSEALITGNKNLWRFKF